MRLTRRQLRKIILNEIRILSEAEAEWNPKQVRTMLQSTMNLSGQTQLATLDGDEGLAILLIDPEVSYGDEKDMDDAIKFLRKKQIPAIEVPVKDLRAQGGSAQAKYFGDAEYSDDEGGAIEFAKKSGVKNIIFIKSL